MRPRWHQLGRDRREECGQYIRAASSANGFYAALKLGSGTAKCPMSRATARSGFAASAILNSTAASRLVVQGDQAVALGDCPLPEELEKGHHRHVLLAPHHFCIQLGVGLEIHAFAATT